MRFALKIENTEVQPLVPIISITHYATKESQLNFLRNATRIVVVAVPQNDLFTVDYGIMYTPYKNVLEKLNMQMGKPQKYNLLCPTKPAKCGIISCVEVY